MSLNDITYLYNKLVKLVPPNLIEILNNKADTSHNHNDLYYGKAIFDNALYNKVDKILGKELSTNDFTNELKSKLDNIDETSNNFSGDYNDLSSIPSTFTPTNHTHIESDIEDLDKYTRLQVDGFLAEKVNKVFGKVLSTNDFTNIDKTKLDSTPIVFAPLDANKNVQVDWNEIDIDSDKYIKNKPTIFKWEQITQVEHDALDALGNTDPAILYVIIG